MALPSSGAISLSQIETEFGGTAPTSLSEYYGAAAGIPGNNNPISFSNFYGTSSNIDLDTIATPVVINGQNSLQEITISDYISSGGQLTIPSGWWIWSDNTSNAGMTIDIPCTIINNGYIIGKGGNGASSGYNGGAGGPAIRINSSVSGVTITNNASAFIAGGGGGGGTQNSTGQRRGGGGGGAGGGDGGQGTSSSGGTPGGNAPTTGAVLNAAAGSNASIGGVAQAGGHGGYSTENSSGSQYARGASGGGRILPGVAHVSTQAYVQQWGGDGTGGAGGVAGSVGHRSGDTSLGGGGGGWGAAGGNGNGGRSVNGSGGAAGKAVEDTGNTYTLTNNGTIYGATT